MRDSQALKSPKSPSALKSPKSPSAALSPLRRNMKASRYLAIATANQKRRNAAAATVRWTFCAALASLVSNYKQHIEVLEVPVMQRSRTQTAVSAGAHGLVQSPSRAPKPRHTVSVNFEAMGQKFAAKEHTSRR